MTTTPEETIAEYQARGDSVGAALAAIRAARAARAKPVPVVKSVPATEDELRQRFNLPDKTPTEAPLEPLQVGINAICTTPTYTPSADDLAAQRRLELRTARRFAGRR